MNICKIPVKSTTWTKGWDANMFFCKNSSNFCWPVKCLMVPLDVLNLHQLLRVSIFFWTPTESRINFCKLMKKCKLIDELGSLWNMIEFHHVWKASKPTKCHVSEIVWFLDLWLPIRLIIKNEAAFFILNCCSNRLGVMTKWISTYLLPFQYLGLICSRKIPPEKRHGAICQVGHPVGWPENLPGLDGSLLLWAVRTSVFTARLFAEPEMKFVEWNKSGKLTHQLIW